MFQFGPISLSNMCHNEAMQVDMAQLVDMAHTLQSFSQSRWNFFVLWMRHYQTTVLCFSKKMAYVFLTFIVLGHGDFKKR